MKKFLLIILFCLPTVIIAQTSHTVNTGMFYYSPSVLNINLGDTVFWINEGGNHNVDFVTSSLTGLSFNNPESFVSIPTSSIEIYSHVFTISGTYYYDCSVYGHAASGMTGSIIVNSINSINEQSNNRELIKVIDLLGRESKVLKNQTLYYIYDDGTVEKKIIIE